MKRFLFASVVILITMALNLARAQDTLKEGKVTMAISFPDAGDKADMMKTAMGSDMVIYFKNGSSRTEMKMSMGSIITIVNRKKHETYSLMNLMGMKYATKFSSRQSDSLNKAYNGKKPKVKLTKDTKKVLGYDCKRAIITTTVRGKKQTTDYWYTNEIIAPSFSNTFLQEGGKIEGIKGFPVQATTKIQNLTMMMTFAGIDKSPVPDSLFEIPADYPIKSMDEIQQGIRSKANAKAASNTSDTAASLSRTFSGPFPEIEMNDVNGNPLKLSSLRGKYVLVDFWASWCSPCRKQSPNLVKAYEEYKDKGFTIYSVSLDKDKGEWQKAITKDKLKWANHVCDFKGWASPVCKQFNIMGIPTNYLLDKEGNVITMGLYDDELEKILKERIK